MGHIMTDIERECTNNWRWAGIWWVLTGKRLDAKTAKDLLFDDAHYLS